MRESTKIVRSTLTPVNAGTEMHRGPVFAAPYHVPGDPTGVPYTYARSNNPTWTELERVIGEMESGEVAGEPHMANAVVFASGMAAIAALFGAVLQPGDAIVMASNSYYTARMLLQEYFVKMGIEVRTSEYGPAGPKDDIAPLLKGAKLLWLETPNNPTMDVTDIAAMCQLAHKTETLVAVDNTTATPLGQKPLALGADFSVASDSKALCGHSDILLGHVAVKDAGLLGKLDRWRTLTGGVLGPMEAWLALRSIPTLPLRLERTSSNALAIAEFLLTRDEVKDVLYPGLPGHPGHAIAKRQMRYFGPVVSFTVLGGKNAADLFLSKAKLLTEATSFGGMTTTAERRARWGGDAVSDGFIRLSAGCEAAEDLIEDIGLALDTLR